MKNFAIGLDKKTRNTDKTTWVEGTVEHLTRGYQPKRCTVYNIEVEDYHTYFVTEHGLWVHNTCTDLLKPIKQKN
jgi:Pretoxin HINT domain